jgi:hypothetical protein
MHNETFLKENLEVLYIYWQTVGFRPGSIEPDEGLLDELANGFIQLSRSIERPDDIPLLPAPPIWAGSNQHR